MISHCFPIVYWRISGVSFTWIPPWFLPFYLSELFSLIPITRQHLILVPFLFMFELIFCGFLLSSSSRIQKLMFLKNIQIIVCNINILMTCGDIAFQHIMILLFHSLELQGCGGQPPQVLLNCQFVGKIMSFVSKFSYFCGNPPPPI